MTVYMALVFCNLLQCLTVYTNQEMSIFFLKALNVTSPDKRSSMHKHSATVEIVKQATLFNYF